MDYSPIPDTIRYPVDPEHSGIRLTVVLLFIIIWVIAYLVIHSLTSSTGIDLIAAVVGFIVTMLATQQIERRLKQRWPSGREVHITPQRIQLRKKANVEDEIDPRQTVNVLLWHFKISKRSRVQKGWLVVACALEQEDTYIPVYTFMAPCGFRGPVRQPPVHRSAKAPERPGQESPDAACRNPAAFA